MLVAHQVRSRWAQAMSLLQGESWPVSHHAQIWCTDQQQTIIRILIGSRGGLSESHTHRTQGPSRHWTLVSESHTRL